MNSPIGLAEKAALVFLGALLLVLRIVYAQHYRLDSDEWQHLHVVWGWVTGRLQYRDFFDNHSPLFQILCTPVLRFFGEHANTILWMRQVMQPLFFFDAWCIYVIARRLGSLRFALWTTLAAAFFPDFLLVSTEFRTDDLWVAFWLLAIVLVVGGEFKGWRAFWTGLVLGAAFAVSMKTSILLACLLCAAVLLFVVARRLGNEIDGKNALPGAGLALLGMIIVPAVVVSYFAARHALPEMYYCVIEHNTFLSDAKMRKFAFKRFWFPLGLILLPSIAYFCLRTRDFPNRPVTFLQALLLLCAAFMCNALRSFWPLITEQDYLPIIPLAVLGLAPLVPWLARFRAVIGPIVTCAFILGEVGWLAHYDPPWQNDADNFVQEVETLLYLTNPSDYIMDGKGKPIFRDRPFYWVLEGVAIKRMGAGLIEDTIPERLVKTRTCVLLNDRLPKYDDEWVAKNFVRSYDKFFIAGRLLGDAQPAMTFTTGIPARYTVVTDGGKLTGSLDGQPLDQPRFLAPGAHTIQVTQGRARVAVIWSQAVERGFSIFRREHWAPTRKTASN